VAGQGSPRKGRCDGRQVLRSSDSEAMPLAGVVVELLATSPAELAHVDPTRVTVEYAVRPAATGFRSGAGCCLVVQPDLTCLLVREAAFRDTGRQRLRRRDALRLTRLGRRGCSCGCSWRSSCPCADVRRCPNQHVKGLTERRRTATNAIMTAWQCRGQGFESPQLHPLDQAVLRFGERPSSFAVSLW
jgi:hypothetical protein